MCVRATDCVGRSVLVTKLFVLFLLFIIFSFSYCNIVLFVVVVTYYVSVRTYLSCTPVRGMRLERILRQRHLCRVFIRHTFLNVQTLGTHRHTHSCNTNKHRRSKSICLLFFMLLLLCCAYYFHCTCAVIGHIFKRQGDDVALVWHTFSVYW